MSEIYKLDAQPNWSQTKVTTVAEVQPATFSEEIKGVDVGNPEFDPSQLSEEQKEQFNKELEKLNQSIASSGKMLRFEFNEEIERYYVEVLDVETQEVVASLPPEFMIDLSIKMKELIGMFIDERR